MTFLQKSSESLDTEFVKLVKQTEKSEDVPYLISRANALKGKSEEQQREYKKYREIIKYFGRKKEKPLNFFKISAFTC